MDEITRTSTFKSTDNTYSVNQQSCNTYHLNFGSVTKLAGSGNVNSAKPGDVYLYTNGMTSAVGNLDVRLKIISLSSNAIVEIRNKIELVARPKDNPWVVYELAVVIS